MTMDVPRAGGRATEAGMAFQAGVATWFAAHLVAQAPVGARFGVAPGATPTRLQLETGRFLDDIEIELSDRSVISVQCKTSASLSRSADSPLGSTIAQLVAYVTARISSDEALRPAHEVAVLAVAADASASLDHLERACRYFDTGAVWLDASNGLNGNSRDALDVFAGHAEREWQVRLGSRPTDADLVHLAKMFRIVRFSVNQGTDLDEAARILGSSILDGSASGRAAIPTLSNIVRRLIATGAPANQQGIIDALRRNGVEDTRNPVYDHDVARLRARTDDELLRLGKHALLPYGSGILLQRDCEEELERAIGEGSLLVIGEPGAGKTGVLVSMAKRFRDAGNPVLFISVDSYESLSGGGGIDQALGLTNRLIDVLAAWPGSAHGVVIVDALDAARGGPVEGVFATLIEEMMLRLAERWSIVASVRTFDLKNGTRFRRLMLDTPPCEAYADDELPEVRHFLIKQLSPAELERLSHDAPALVDRIQSSPEALRGLIGNVFNLSLFADLLTSSALDGLDEVTTQLELIDRYENERLGTQDRIVAASTAVKAMVERKSLVVPRHIVTHGAIEDVLHSGVLNVTQDRLSFSHHVLFDHVAGRFYLDTLDAGRLAAQLAQDRAIGFLLGPAFRFAMERMWRNDRPGRPNTWDLVQRLAASENVDPVLSSIAMRSTAERIRGPEDVAGLARLLSASKDYQASGKALSRVARFGRLSLKDGAILAPPVADAWADLAISALATGRIEYADAARIIMLMLFEKADPNSPAFGEASRNFLRYAWDEANGHETLTSIGLRSVGKSFGTSPLESRALLERIFEPEHFAGHAHEEANWLAEAVSVIAEHDRAFALKIYQILFGRPSPQTGQTWLGGQASRILPLSISKEQSYEHARWQLTRAYPSFLRTAPGEATQAASASVLGPASHRGRRLETVVTSDNFVIVEDLKSLEEWREDRGRGTEENSILTAFVQFLRKCSADEYWQCIAAAHFHETASSVWARLFGVGAERIELVAGHMWRIATDLDVLRVDGLRRDALQFIAAAFPSRTLDERTKFETELTANARDDEFWRDVAARLLSLVPRDLLVTEHGRALFDELHAAEALRGNRPYVSFTMHSGPVTTDSLLESSGVSIHEGVEGELRAVARPLEALLKEVRDGPDGDQIAEMWEMSRSVVADLDRLQVAEDSERAAWAAVGETLERIAESEAYDPDRMDHPSLDALLELIDVLADSPYPEPRESNGGTMGWGNWDIRIYAASGTMELSRRFGSKDPSILDRLRRHLADPVATVRLQVAQAINTLFEVDEDRMWALMDVASQDQDPAVLGFFVSGPLLRVFNADPARCAAMTDSIVKTSLLESNASTNLRSLHEALGHLAALQWLIRSSEAAKAWIDEWTTDVGRHHDLLWSVISQLRGALFARYAEPGWEDPTIQDRARTIANAVLRSAGHALDGLQNDERRLSGEDGKRLARKADSLVDHVCAELYFGSGAYERTEQDEVGLRDVGGKKLFLRDYRNTLKEIARLGSARTHHQLTELYTFLVEASPELVFDDVADLLLGHGAEQQLQNESLASERIVALVRTYLADYKWVFADGERRTGLVKILELFSSAGSPEAMTLLYDLPDLLR